ncbi:MAG TPA: hypothetical protein VMU09_01455, partial [Acidimicrobiales bacterium]|nr:hypothetical protein [Acidimicrobiales bacterium]
MIPKRFEPLLEATAELAGRFDHAGRRLYLVGGSVRDAFVAAGAPEGQTHPHGAATGALTDYDFTTDAHPDEVERILSGWADAVWAQGKQFGTIGARKGGRTYEVTTHRAEAYGPDSRKPEVSFGDSVEVDLSRRDFTVNAMALRLPDLELVADALGRHDG